MSAHSLAKEKGRTVRVVSWASTGRAVIRYQLVGYSRVGPWSRRYSHGARIYPYKRCERSFVDAIDMIESTHPVVADGLVGVEDN
jgi:hypothetical protein